jgi:hypothetical protein
VELCEPLDLQKDADGQKRMWQQARHRSKEEQFAGCVHGCRSLWARAFTFKRPKTLNMASKHSTTTGATKFQFAAVYLWAQREIRAKCLSLNPAVSEQLVNCSLKYQSGDPVGLALVTAVCAAFSPEGHRLTVDDSTFLHSSEEEFTDNFFVLYVRD